MNANFETSESIKKDILILLQKYEIIRLMYTNPFLEQSISHLEEIQQVCKKLIKNIEQTLRIAEFR
jgi:UDP-glucose 6-dehydrogenase